MSFSKLQTVSVLTIALLTACGSSPVIEPLVDLGDPTAVSQTAMNLWRKQQLKGSCSGCHSADFYDLARIGFTFDPSFARISGSNSTKVGEYMIASLLEANMHLHDSFFTLMRLCAKGSLVDGNYKSTPAFKPDYGYFLGYGRELLRWNWNKGDPIIPDAQKTEQTALWHKFTSNGFRTSLYLYLNALEQMDVTALAAEKTWALGKDGVLGVNSATGKTDDRTPWVQMQNHFTNYQSESSSADTALIAAVTTKLGL